MVRLVFVLVFSTLSLYAAPYWIQVSSVGKHRHVAPALLATIKKSGFAYNILEEHGRQKVRVGSFAHYKEALQSLPKVRCKIAHDAFIVPHTMVKRAVPVLKKAIVDAKPAVAKVVTSEEKPPLAPQTTAVPCECMYDVHLLRKTELEKALAYYKHAKYYEFNTSR